MKNTLLIIVALIIVLLTPACAATPKNFDQALQLIEKAASLAERQGIAYDATLRWNGKLGGGWINRVELDTGVTAEINFHGNAAAERATVPNSSPNPNLNP